MCWPLLTRWWQAHKELNKVANPQTENGHIDFANEIAEKLCRYRISGQEYQVLWVIWRKTWGWHKKEDMISLSQIVKMTEMKRSQVCRSLAKLLDKNIITSPQKDTSYVKIYRFNKDYDGWKPSIQKDTGSPQKDTGVVPIKGTKLVPIRIHTKETKETITKERYSDVPSQDINLFISLFKEINPSFEQLFKNKTERSAASRLILKYGIEKMTNTVGELPKIIIAPYAPRITTPYELERNLGKLIAFVSQQKVIDKPTSSKIAFQ